MRSEEVIAAFPVARERVPVAHRVRSTLITSSQMSLREHGLHDRYLQALPAADHAAVLDVAAGAWIPIEVAMAHYAACDALGLSDPEVLALGNAVAKMTEKTSLSMLLKAAQEVGATPLLFFANAPKYWARIFQGGAVAAFKLGPKEARFETVGVPLARYRYWRTAYGGLLRSVSAPFCRTIYLRELPERGSPTSVSFRFQWA